MQNDGAQPASADAGHPAACPASHHGRHQPGRRGPHPRDKPKTLRLHYRDELDLSLAKANATIGGALFNKAKGGDTAAMIFWMKTQAGWKEKSVVEGLDSHGQPVNRNRRRPGA